MVMWSQTNLDSLTKMNFDDGLVDKVRVVGDTERMENWEGREERGGQGGEWKEMGEGREGLCKFFLEKG